jgi:hypothetical protein
MHDTVATEWVATPKCATDSRWWRAPEIALLGAVLLAGVLLESRDGESVELRMWSAVKLPEVCAARRCFGWRCPLCGATRSCLYLMHGQWRESLAVHRLGWLCLSVIAITAVMALACRGFRLGSTAFSARFTWWCWSVTIGLLLANRAAELCGW